MKLYELICKQSGFEGYIILDEDDYTILKVSGQDAISIVINYYGTYEIKVFELDNNFLKIKIYTNTESKMENE